MASGGEAALRTQMVNRIRNLPEPSWAKVVHGSRYQDAGEPDIDAIVNGVPLKVEVKLPGKQATPIQAVKLRRYRAMGCVAGVAHDVGELDALIDECRRAREFWGSECLECGNSTHASMECDSCGSEDATKPLYMDGR